MTDPRLQPDLHREFPLRCVIKVIALDLDGLQQRVDECLVRLEHPARALPGNHSSSGKYITYNIDIEFLTLESMRLTINELRTIHGVRVVL
jgi:putative lipoic acid-binding regulatory protein